MRPDPPPMTPTILFGAYVNGIARTVQIEIDHPDQTPWAIAWTDGTTQGGVPDDDDLAAIETLVMNNEYLYNSFYDGASDADYDAELIDPSAEVL